MRREHDHKPVASFQRGSDFIMPLLSALDILLAEEGPHAMGAERLRQPTRKGEILAGM